MPTATLEKDGVDGDILHHLKNRPSRHELEAIAFPLYKFRPFPCAVYREWDQNTKQAELYRVAARNSYDLNKPAEFAEVARTVGEHETRLVGVNDFDEADQVVSSLRERNEKELAFLLDNGWATTPDGVKDAVDRMNKRIALAAGERAYDDRRLGEKAREELDRIETVTEGHVVDVAESRRAATEAGALKKDKR